MQEKKMQEHNIFWKTLRRLSATMGLIILVTFGFDVNESTGAPDINMLITGAVLLVFGGLHWLIKRLKTLDEEEFKRIPS